MRGSGLDAGVDKKAVGDRVWIYRAGKKQRASATVYLGLRGGHHQESGITGLIKEAAPERKRKRGGGARRGREGMDGGEAGLRCPLSDEGAREYSTRTDGS